MQNRLFQNTLNQLKKDIKRIIGVIDDNGTIIACSDESRIGSENENILSLFEGGSDIKVINSCSYKRVETYNKSEYIVFCEGDDELAKGYCSFLGTHFLTIKQYYDEKYDKNSFVKNVIVDNVLPGDVLYRSRELHLTVEARRVVFIVRMQSNVETSIVEILLGLFPDKSRDFIVQIDSRDVAVIKEIKDDVTTEDIMKLAQNMLDLVMSEAMVKVCIGISTPVDTIQELSGAYREARIALEVGKVFDTEKNIISYENLGIGRLIYQLPTTLCELFLNEVFKKESINVLDSETIYTIQKFFENNLNVSETSRKLFVHRNTLVYRLDKIKKLTGLDLREFDDAIIFKVAMMVNKYLISHPTRL